MKDKTIVRAAVSFSSFRLLSLVGPLSAMLVFSGVAQSRAGPSRLLAVGGTITTSGLYRVHTFTSNGTFQVLAGAGEVEVLVVAGGGGGACGNDGIASGGGAGGVIYTNGFLVSGANTVIVGQGGAGGYYAEGYAVGQNGSNSVFSTLTAIGGGHGAKFGGYEQGAGDGGSGGGACLNFPTPGTGIAGQGHDGGEGYAYPESYAAGGGGGAGTKGSNGVSDAAGNGGAGIACSITGMEKYYGGGGGAGVWSGGPDTPGSGGIGGGGDGAKFTDGEDGEPNTGGGGGGEGMVSTTNVGGRGGSGIVIVRYYFSFFPGPDWWYARGAVDTNLPANDFAPITLGQLKWLAFNARAEMDANFGAGPEVAQVVNAFGNAGNFTVATIGQVKYVAQPFYDRLYDFHLTSTFPNNMPGDYPWPRYSSGNDFVPALIGQAKYVFSFDSAVDSDGDGLSDWREAGLGTNPYDPDTDGDGFDDGWEVEHGKDPLNPADADQEELNRREETRSLIVRHWILWFGTPPVFTNIPGSAADLNDMRNALNTLSGKFYKVQ